MSARSASAPRPLRILDLRDTYEIGGPGKTILETFRAIDTTQFELHLGVFLTRHEKDDSPFILAARSYGMPVHLIRGHNQYDPRLIGRIAELVRTLNIDIVHAHEVKSDVLTYLAGRLHRVPIMTTLHGFIGNSLKQRLMTGIDRYVIQRFDRVIVVSQRMSDELQAANVRMDNVRLLHNAIVIENYRRTGERGFLAALVGRPLVGPIIASIGRLSPEKGHSDLIDALGIAARQGHTVTAVLAGDGPDRAQLLEKVRALGLDHAVHLPGYVSQPDRVLEETDLLVLPSHTEGLPNAALEAMVMEVPLLATRVGGTPEVVTDGETGRLVNPRSPEALAAGIIGFLKDPQPWKDMARQGRTMVERQFNFHTRTRLLEQMYREVALGSRP